MAVIVALELLLIVDVVAVKVAEVADAATATDTGTVRLVFELDNVTVAPPVGAAWLSVTVQVVDELAPRLVGLQVTDDTRTAAVRVTVAVAELLL